MHRLLPILMLVAALPAQAEIFKWIDESGRTHFGEVVPDKYQKSATSLAPQPTNTIEGANLRGPGIKPTATAPATPPEPSAADKCLAEQERYRKSQDCLAAHRNANGSFRPEVLQNCEDVPKPPPCPFRR